MQGLLSVAVGSLGRRPAASLGLRKLGAWHTHRGLTARWVGGWGEEWGGGPASGGRRLTALVAAALALGGKLKGLSHSELAIVQVHLHPGRGGVGVGWGG